MRHNARKSNQSFMFSIMAMAFIVLIVAGLFLYLSIPAK